MSNRRNLIEILSRGPRVWNEWRSGKGIQGFEQAQGGFQLQWPRGSERWSASDYRSPNLMGADLCAARLKGVNLENADLRGANFSDADLREANFNKANLTRAKLSKAKLEDAEFGDSDLSDANLLKADLSGAYLKQTNLRRANLSGAIIQEAYLKDANLNRADLENADFRGAELSRAFFVNANLKGADFREAELENSSFRGADLRGAKFSNANLPGADLTSATLGATTFLGSNLSGVEGLKTCTHESLSTIDSATLTKSVELPFEFLRGFGISEEGISATQGSNTILIDVREAIWAQLFPIEQALSATLGRNYVVEKGDDHILVRLDIPDQFPAAMNAVMPVLAALESVSRGEVQRLTLQPEDGVARAVEGRALQEQLSAIQSQIDYVAGRVDHEFPPDRSRLNAPEEALVTAVEGGPSGLAALALRKWFQTGDQIGDWLNRLSFQIYLRFQTFFQSAKGLTELPEQSASETPPESTEDKT